jgi:16S rRNA G966 N2-methylase RsmD
MSDSFITLPISDIIIENRYRKEFGDIDALANDINKIGLIVPITVTYNPTTKKYTLVDGQRRILAYQRLERTEIPCYLINLEKIILGEYSANTFRKYWTDSELYTITEALKPIFIEEAKRRQSEAGKLFGRGKKNVNVDDNKPIAMGNFPQANTKGRALDNLSNAFGIDRKTLDKIQKIGDAAKENPDKYQQLFQKVDSKKISREEAVSIIKKAEKKEMKELELQRRELENPKLSLPEGFELTYSDFRQVELEKGSAQLIFTDPPYGEQYLYLYEDLAKKADEILNDGDSLVFYVGHIILDKVIKIFDKYPKLKYFWTFAVRHSGPSATVHPRKAFARWKPMLWYVKGKRPENIFTNVPDMIEIKIPDIIDSKKPDKTTHEWAQSIEESEHIIRYLTIENQTILDPMMGDGITGIAARKLGRKFRGIEIDEGRFKNAKANIKVELGETETKNSVEE